MDSSSERRRSNNPFATHRTRPGALEFCFPTGTTAQSLASRLSENGWRGQIVGPHGSGKSTLLTAILPALRMRGAATREIALHDGQRRLPADSLARRDSAQQMVLVIDGYEQLSLFWRLWLRWCCWRRGWGLLISTHRPAVWLPVLVMLAPSGEVMGRLLDRLLAGYAPLVSRYDADASFSRHNGNLREVWFDLYDQYERTQRGLMTAKG